MKSTLLILSAVILIGNVGARADEVPRDQYLKQVPLGRMRLVRQTTASEALHLYGDREAPGYRDANPVDGIDDARGEILRALAVRFAPILIQNTSNIPTNFDVYIANRDEFPLFIDTWDVSGVEPRLTESRGVNFSALGAAECSSDDPGRAWEDHPHATRDGAVEDCKLVALLDENSPTSAREEPIESRFVRSRPEYFDVLFFDFPGDGPGTWEAAYEEEYEATPEKRRRVFPHAYVHPFLVAVHGDGELLGYELVLQYWFFYPTNDSGMNHEGDWEHMNVVVSPMSMVEQPLPAETVERVLTGALPAKDGADDPLVIRRVDYYFHHLVMTLDYSSPNVYRPRREWKAAVKGRPEQRVSEHELWEAIRHVAYVDDDETTVNTHPFGYIGADNKGFDQALAAPGGKNRNPHGTYPFPGSYRNVGPGGTTDRVSVHVDPREYWEDLKRGKVSKDPVFERGHVLNLADADRLRIVPDWERIIEPVRNDARARREWSWLILPIRWGYPATQSPFSGVLEHFDTGNVAPPGPSFNGGWNASGTSPGFQAYEPHLMPSVFPVGLQDSFRNDLGFFNLTVPVLLNLPPLDFLSRIVVYPVKLAVGNRDPVYYPKEGVPFRFVGISSGVSTQIVDSDFSALVLNPAQFDNFVASVIFHLVLSGADSTTSVLNTSDSMSRSVGPFFQMTFYIGGHFASENMVRNTRADFDLTADFNNIPSYTYHAELNYWEYAGSIRYSVLTSRWQPFVKAGYGWSWSRWENAQSDGVPFDPADSGWIKPKSIWPTVWHFGLGLEFIPWKRPGKLPGGTDIAFRIEYARYLEGQGLDVSGIPIEKLGIVFDTVGDIPSGNVSRDDFLFGVTVSF